jgi:antitoxin ParD1/3/4
MNTMNIAIPEQLKAFVQRQVERRGYSSVSEYVRDLIRDDQGRQTIAALEVEIIKGLESGPGTPVTKEYWEGLRQQVRDRTATRQQGS